MMTALVQEGSTINKNSWKNGSIVTISTTSMYVVSGKMVAYLGPYWSGNWHQPATMYNELKHGKKCIFGDNWLWVFARKNYFLIKKDDFSVWYNCSTTNPNTHFKLRYTFPWVLIFFSAHSAMWNNGKMNDPW